MYGCDKSKVFILVAALGLIMALPVGAWRSRHRYNYNVPTPRVPEGQKLLIILMDGFRHDFLKSPKIESFPNLRRLVQEGSRVDRTLPVFPSSTFPNFYALLSGVSVNGHSMGHNYMYDSATGKQFTSYFRVPGDFDPQWWRRDTIAHTAQKQGKKTQIYNFPLCAVPDLIQPPMTVCDQDVNLLDLQIVESHFMKAADGFAADLDLGFIYVGEPDNTIHTLGIDHPAVNLKVMEIDDIIGRFLRKVTSLGLENTLNIMLISDHGMITVEKEDFTYWGSAIDRDDFDHIATTTGIIVQLWPKAGKEDKVVEKLRRSGAPIQVYRRSEIPEEWNMKEGQFVPPVYVIADFGHVFIENDTQVTFSNQIMKGYHGYHVHHPDMSGTCLGWGPAFKKGYKHGIIRATDVYEMYATILGINPEPHEGSFRRVRPMFAPTFTARRRNGYRRGYSRLGK